MPTKIAQDAEQSAYRFDAVAPFSFDAIATIGAGVANTTIQARLPVPSRMKIQKVCVDYSAIADTTGDHKFNIVLGTGSYTQGSVIPDDTGRYVGALAVQLPGGIAPVTVGANGQALFSADQALTAAADSPVVFVPTNYDGIIEQGSLLTLRVVTPASTGSISNLKITLVACIVAPYSGMAPDYPESSWAVPSSVPVTAQNPGW